MLQIFGQRPHKRSRNDELQAMDQKNRQLLGELKKERTIRRALEATVNELQKKVAA